MDQDMWMAVKAYMPAAALVIASFVLTALAGKMGQSHVLAQFARDVGWCSIAAFAGALLLGAHATYRLWRAEKGEGLLCGCGGLLKGEIDGRYGPYRQCMRCSRNVPRREYEALE